MSANENATERWRRLAAEAFREAQWMTDADSRATMLKIAAGYDRLADRAERERKSTTKQVARGIEPPRTMDRAQAGAS
jgi:hypothetical protein